MVRLAAQIADVTIWSVYGVLKGRVTSKRVQLAIDQARAQLNRAKRAA
jgi:ribosome-associated translation inhibitor RaiA